MCIPSLMIGEREYSRRDQESVDFAPQCLSEFPATHISHRMQRQTIVQLIMIQHVLPNTVNDKMEELMLLVQEQGHGQVPDLFLGVFVRRDEIDGLEVAEVDVVALNVDIEQFAHVFLLLVAVQAAGLELLSDVGQLLIHTLLLQFSGPGIP